MFSSSISAGPCPWVAALGCIFMIAWSVYLFYRLKLCVTLATRPTGSSKDFFFFCVSLVGAGSSYFKLLLILIPSRLSSTIIKSGGLNSEHSSLSSCSILNLPNLASISSKQIYYE
jgi:hypothetical protein